MGSISPDVEDLAEELTLNESYRLLANAPIGVYLSSPEGRFLYTNKAMAQMLGYASSQELVASIHDTASQLYARTHDRELFVRILEEKRQMVHHDSVS